MIETVSIEYSDHSLIIMLFTSFSRFSGGLPALWLCLVVYNACNAMALATPYTVYRGTFIHLPRLDSTSAKPELVRNQGVMWVSSADGRIKGSDWSVNDDASFQSFLSSHGWTDASSSTAGDSTAVQVVQSDDERNEFFFPGFIGMSHLTRGTMASPNWVYV